jgi:autotransporter-associated beta strand protein
VGIRATGTTATVGGNSNSLEVYDGGSLTTVTPIYVGSSVAIGGTESTNNSLSIGNGTSNIASLTVNANATQFNAAAGYDGVYTVPGTTTPVAVQTSSYSVPSTGSLTAQGIFLNGTTSVLNFNNGRLIAGASSTGTLVSGSGTVNLNGPAYVSTALANSIISSLISGTGSFTKEGTGLLTLSNASNAYLGDTTVSGGTLSLAAAFLADAATVTLASGSVLDLNYLATDTIGNLVLGGATQAAGTYGAIGSGAGVQTAYLTGTGILNVAAVVPEPETMVLLGAGLAAVGFLRRRRHA